MKHSTHQSGFTLLEIMLVVMIIAILVGGAIAMFGGNIEFAGKTKARADIQSISTQLMVYQAKEGFFPSTDQGLRALVEKPGSDPVPHNWSQSFQELPLDPWHQPYLYQCPGTHNPESFDVYSGGNDRKPGTPDDIGNWKQQQ